MISDGKSVARAPPPLTLMATLKACPALHHLISDTEGADETDGWHRAGWFTAWNHGATLLKLVREKELWHLTEPCKNCLIQAKFRLITWLLFSRCTDHVTVIVKIILTVHCFPNMLHSFLTKWFSLGMLRSGCCGELCVTIYSSLNFLFFFFHWVGSFIYFPTTGSCRFSGAQPIKLNNKFEHFLSGRFLHELD